ncbi:hypothetical protein [Effusibacillus consociatus]|uniref:Uncharacterized protein n=1 Tax=Effusibacillus consociatus TaxID=1117041 RepID=A0ABV9Q9T3_9BACL
MHNFKLDEINERIQKARGMETLIRSKRQQRPTDNKPRSEEEKLLLIEIASRRRQENMIRIGERKWRYVGK